MTPDSTTPVVSTLMPNDRPMHAHLLSVGYAGPDVHAHSNNREVHIYKNGPKAVAICGTIAAAYRTDVEDVRLTWVRNLDDLPKYL